MQSPESNTQSIYQSYLILSVVEIKYTNENLDLLIHKLGTALAPTFSTY